MTHIIIEEKIQKFDNKRSYSSVTIGLDGFDLLYILQKYNIKWICESADIRYNKCVEFYKSELTELFERGMILVRWARRWEQDTEKLGFVYEVTYGYKD